MKTPLCALLLALAILIPVSAAADSHFSSDPTVVQARMLVSNGRFDEALSLLGGLNRDHPDKVDVLFLTGMAAIGAAGAREDDEAAQALLLNGAIAALRLILIDRPELTRVRLELARAFFLKGEDELARRHFEVVLAGRPAPPVVANIRRFLAHIRARARWRYHVGFALAPDSNIGSGSEERTIYIPVGSASLPFQRDAAELTTSGIGVSVWGGAEYQYPLGDELRLRAGGQFARREYAGSQFDQLFLAAHLGPRWLVDRDTEVSLLASARQRWVGTA